MTESLKCTKVIRSSVMGDGTPLGRDNQGNQVFDRRRCGMPAAEYEIGGMLTKAKATLCLKHKEQADREAFVSENGYGAGKTEKEDYRQKRLPGTGVIG